MYKSTEIYDDKPHEECGVFGIFDHNLSAVHEVYYGIFALQHRGQESAGITVTDGKEMETFRGMGLVTEVFRNLPERKVTSASAMCAIPRPALPSRRMSSRCRQTASMAPWRSRITAIW